MAIYNGRILMRKGNEADFDPSKLMSGEWALSTDKGIIRICLEAGKVIRMATYEAFEKDMEQVEAILLECQSIEEAVRRINTEVSEKLNACAEYVQQAKNYSEQAKTSEANAKSYMQSAKTSEENAKVSETNAKASENSAKEYENSAKLTEERAREVFESIPEDYSTISNDLYELAIKETASGEEIHVNDSSNLKLREFSLYGKAKQNTTQGNQLFDAKALTSVGSISVNVSEDSYTITAIGKSAYTNTRCVLDVQNLKGKTIYVKLDSISMSNTDVGRLQIVTTDENNTRKYISWINETQKSVQIPENISEVAIQINTNNSGSALEEDNTIVIKGLIVSLTENAEWEPFTNGASPNPQYPQPIEVSGARGSVEVKSCGNNIVKSCLVFSVTNNYDALINNVTASIKAGKQYTISVELSATNDTKAYWNYLSGVFDRLEFTVLKGTKRYIYTFIAKADFENSINPWLTKSATNDGIKINTSNVQIEEGTGTPYEPYKETLSTIPTPNGLAGIDDVRDEKVKFADGSGKHIQRFGMLNVAECDVREWGTGGGGHDFYIRMESHEAGYGSKALKTMCNKFRSSSSSAWSINEVIYRTVGNDDWSYYGRLIFRVPPEIDNVEKFKEYVGNDCIVIYERIKPIETPLTAEEIAEIEKLHTFYPVTNISNDFDCGMSVTYYADSKNYINNQLAIMKQEQEEAMANMLLLMPTEVQATMIENDTNELLKESEI